MNHEWMNRCNKNQWCVYVCKLYEDKRSKSKAMLLGRESCLADTAGRSPRNNFAGYVCVMSFGACDGP